MKTGFTSRLWAYALMVVFFSSFQVQSAELSAAFVFSTDEGGNPAGDFVWDTRGVESDFYKIFIAGGGIGDDPNGLTNSFINGPTWATAPLNLTLSEGTNKFTMFFQHNGDWSSFGLNLFFNHEALPGISVKGPVRTGEAIPPYSANSAHRTFTMTSFPGANGPASGSTSVALDSVIELTEYYVAAASVFESDRVATHQANSNDRLDYVGTFTLVVTTTPGAPRIMDQPDSQAVAVGDSASFTVVAEGNDPLQFQWSKNGAELPGQTNASLTLQDVQITDQGQYRVRVSNGAGSVLSSQASLTVLTPGVPQIVDQPDSQTVAPGEEVSFSVIAGGQSPLRYQWTRNGMYLFGATNSSLTLPNVRFSDQGRYRVRVSNPYGSVLSSEATLTVVMSGNVLTAAFVLSTDAGGNPAGNFVWDTRGSESDFYKIFMSRGGIGEDPDGLTNAFINGPSWAEAPLNYELSEGTNKFTIFFQHNGDWPSFGLNLFFNGNALPGISVMGPARTNGTIPAFSVNSAPRTFTMTSFPSADGPAAGTNRVILDSVVELTDYYVAARNVFAADRVSTHNVGSNQRLDFVGTFTLVVHTENHNQEPVVQVDLLPAAQLSPAQSGNVVIAGNGEDAVVFLDARKSFDPDGDPLSFACYRGTEQDAFASGALVWTRAAVGNHTLTVVAGDGNSTGSATVAFEVVTASEAVAAIADSLALALSRKSSAPLLATLRAAMRALEAGDVSTALRQLDLFQHKVAAQVGRTNPLLANRLSTAARQVVIALRSAE